MQENRQKLQGETAVTVGYGFGFHKILRLRFRYGSRNSAN
jgi:hypothetical protein